MAKRYYVIPMAYPATNAEQSLKEFSKYGVSMLDIFGSVWRSIIEDDQRYHLDVANYVARAIRQQWSEERLIGAGRENYMQQEIDEATIKCIEVCSDIKDHVHRYMDIIQDVELRDSKADDAYWSIFDLDGNDVIVLCEDPSDTPKKDLSITSDVDIVTYR